MIQAKAECYFTNGTDRVQFVVRFIFNLEEYARFDSDVGEFVALTELGRPDVELWNHRPDILERSRASVDALCRHNYQLGAPFTVGRKGESCWDQHSPPCELATTLLHIKGSFLLQDAWARSRAACVRVLSPDTTHSLSS